MLRLFLVLVLIISSPIFANALHDAVKAGNYQVAVRILNETEDFPIDEPDNDGFTPLQVAVQSGDIGLAILMLAFDAKVDKKNYIGASALHWAVSLEKIDMVHLLMKNGANPLAVDGNARTPVDIARDMRLYDFLAVLQPS